MATDERLDGILRGIERWFEKKRPGVSEVVLRSAGTPKAGHSNETLLADADWVEAGKRQTRPLVLRIGQIGEGLQVFPEYDLSLQYKVMERLAGTAVPVPALQGFEEDPEFAGAPFFLMDRIDGECPVENPPYHAQGWLAEVSAEDRAAIWDSGLEVVAALQAVDWREKDFDFLVHPERGVSPLDQQLTFYRQYFEWVTEGRDFPLAAEAFSWLDTNRPAKEPTVLCWGDAKLANMLFRGTRCVAALDWEMAHLGNPVDDLAWYMNLDRSLSEGCNLPRLEGFPSREASIARWEELCGRPAKHVEYYEVFSALRLSLIIFRVVSNLKQVGLFPADSEFDLNNNASVVLENELAVRR